MTKAWRQLLYPGRSRDFFALRAMPNLDLEAQHYHQGNAVCCAELSRLVYRHDIEEDAAPPHPTRREFLVRGGFEQLAFFQDRLTHTQAMLVRHQASGLRVLVFRGTEQDIRDFITDSDVGGIGLVPAGGEAVFVHRGFERALNSVWGAIQNALEAEHGPVWVTGHSLGAALATLACTRYQFLACYTFGSPRVGNQAFADSLLTQSIFRVVDDEDLVCKVPLESMGFVHVGQLIELRGPRPSLGLASLVNPVKPLADHTPRFYVTRL